MFAPQMTPEERSWIKLSIIGAIITSGVAALVELGKDEIKHRIERDRKKEAS
jgi:hypothetical protein